MSRLFTEDGLLGSHYTNGSISAADARAMGKGLNFSSVGGAKKTTKTAKKTTKPAKKTSKTTKSTKTTKSAKPAKKKVKTQRGGDSHEREGPVYTSFGGGILPKEYFSYSETPQELVKQTGGSKRKQHGGGSDWIGTLNARTLQPADWDLMGGEQNFRIFNKTGTYINSPDLITALGGNSTQFTPSAYDPTSSPFAQVGGAKKTTKKTKTGKTKTGKTTTGKTTTGKTTKKTTTGKTTKKTTTGKTTKKH